MAEYNRSETPMARGAHWPDGSPVSNWSQAVAAMVLHRAKARTGAPPADQAGAGALETDRTFLAAA